VSVTTQQSKCLTSGAYHQIEQLVEELKKEQEVVERDKKPLKVSLPWVLIAISLVAHPPQPPSLSPEGNSTTGFIWKRE